MNVSRRSFITHALPLPLAGLAANAPARDRPRHLKLSCNMYSFNGPLRDGTMTLEEAIDACADMGFAAVDPTAYYLPGYPDVPANEVLYRIKKHAFLRGLDISGTGVRNDFTQPTPEARSADLAHVKRWIEAAAAFDAPVLRVFDGRSAPDGADYETVFGWIVDNFRACVAHGRAHGVMVVFQPHHEYLKTAGEVLRLIEAIDSDWFGLNLDIGSLRVGDPYEEVARLAPHACTWQIKETVFRGMEEVRTDLNAIARIVLDSGYRGYLPLETLGPGDPVQKLTRFVAEVRDAFAL